MVGSVEQDAGENTVAKRPNNRQTAFVSKQYDLVNFNHTKTTLCVVG